MSESDSGHDGRLAVGTQINGTLKFKRLVQIDGRFEGDIKSAGKLILGPTAEVDADISVGELEIHGQLRGKVKANDRLVIRDGGVVEATITAGKLAIEAGAVFRGNCEMPAPGSAAPSPGPKASAPDTAKPAAPLKSDSGAQGGKSTGDIAKSSPAS